MKYYLSTVDEVLQNVSSNNSGLGSSETNKRLMTKGFNKLTQGKKVSLVRRLIGQLSDPMIIVLLIAAFVSGLVSFYSGESFADTFIILFVVIVNAALGVYQESKAEMAIEALNKMASATSKVLRDGQLIVIKSEEIVVGDVIILEAGDAVPADARIIESYNLKVEESALTGESVPVLKIVDRLSLKDKNDITLSERKNMVYMGSTVVYGRGRAVIVASGMDTEMGKIAKYIETAKEEKTPLQKRLNQLSKVLSFTVIGICIFMFLFRILVTNNFGIENLIDTFMIAISLAVAAIPEGLATVVTIQLAIGVTKMAKHNAIIRKLTAVETLGCTQVICSDKTGTLTQNKMTVTKTYCDNEKLLFIAFSLCSDAEIDGNGKISGDPTEVALVKYAEKFFKKSELTNLYNRVDEAPFSSERKMMSTICSTSGNKFIQFTKGAPDIVLSRCTKYLKDGKIINLTEEAKEEVIEQNKSMAANALRVLGAACKDYEIKPEFSEPEEVENELVFLGIAGMIDPVREEALAAVIECKSAGIRPIMITGDHKDTAVAIARELGIAIDSSQALTGDELEKLNDEELLKAVNDYSVYARVQPEHKVRIVNAFKRLGQVVAMTGDGVNDAPSIKNADIGVGMGIVGTDVTKNVADMVLADDNFATIVTAVREGRRIYSNIQKAIQFLISSNISEIIAIFFATILNFIILSPIHILWINLITDTFPALALGMEKEEKGLMKQKPRDAKEGIFSGGVLFDVIYQGILIAAITLAAYFIGHFLESGKWEITNSRDGMTMAFLTMSLAEIFHSFNVRSTYQSLFKIGNKNSYLIGSLIFSLFLINIVVFVPAISKIFEMEPVNFLEYMVAVGLSLSIIPVVEIVKAITRN
ncbi:MAG: Calcium-transporting ATPase 1 [Eubacteriales bacterium SKADARSKE-1]|nr:Calcium-transporting ATPase 1 [Eubacteriales bacterium SKADARSKE-1]